MLMRVCTTKAECLGVHFHESAHRTTRDLQHQDWAEFIVAWRQDFIEIYEDYVGFRPFNNTHNGWWQFFQSTSLQEWAVGHKHLAYLIPLKSPWTLLSLYSFVDMTFCITCRPTQAYLKSKLSRNEPEGTCVYIFKTRSRSRAYDWTWKLWYVICEIFGKWCLRVQTRGVPLVVKFPKVSISGILVWGSESSSSFLASISSIMEQRSGCWIGATSSHCVWNLWNQSRVGVILLNMKDRREERCNWLGGQEHMWIGYGMTSMQKVSIGNGPLCVDLHSRV